MKKISFLITVLTLIQLAGCCHVDKERKMFTDPNDFCGSDIEKIQSAVNAAAKNGGKVIITARRPDKSSDRDFWLIDSAILLPSNTTLILDNCRIKLSDRCRDNMIRSANCGMGVESVPPVSNIRICGIGKAVLEGADNPRATGDSGKTLYVTDPQSRQSYGTDAGKSGESQTGDWRNIMILLVNVNDFSLENLNIIDSHCWAVSLEYCTRGTVKNLHFESRQYKMINGKKHRILNQDGLDLRRGCSYIDIENISGFSGDDLIALTVLPGKLRQPGVPGTTEMCGAKENMRDNDTHDIRIRNVTGFCAGGHHIVRFLNASGVKLYNITLENLFDTSPAGFRCKAAVKIGDRNPAWGGGTPLGDTHSFKLHNIVSKAESAILIGGSLAESKISQVLNLNPENPVIVPQSGENNIRNVETEEFLTVK